MTESGVMRADSLYHELCDDLRAYQARRVGLFVIICRIFTTPGFLAGFLYRLSSRMTRKGGLGKAVARFVWRLNVFMNACDISPQALIASGLYMPHPMGVVIGAAVIGNRVMILQNCTIGKKDVKAGNDHGNFPHIGNDVVVGAGACLLGNIRIGNNVFVAANSVVIQSVPDDSLAAGVPARIRPRG